jgi:hypothetical protein
MDDIKQIKIEIKKENNIKFWNAFKIPGIIQFCISMFFGKLAMSALFYWYPTYL